MKRGDIVTILAPGGPASKARPYLVVQRTVALADAPKVTICPLSSEIRVDISTRPLINPTSENGLRRVSQIEVDWIYTYETELIGKVIGTVDDATLQNVDEALRRWLDL